MRVEDAFEAPIFTDYDDALKFIRSNGSDSCFIMGAKGKVADRLGRDGVAFRALEFIRTDRGIWSRKENCPSLPLGCLSSKAWMRRLSGITVIRTVDTGAPWIWKGRSMMNSVLVQFDISSETVSGGFFVRQFDLDNQAVGSADETEDLGQITAEYLHDPRHEIVIETTAEDARRVRQLPGVHHISQRKVGDSGRVRITVDLPASSIVEATTRSRIWARSSIRAMTGVLLYQSKQQWEELAGLLNGMEWSSGRIICESPRWVLIDTSDGISSDDVVRQLMEWRIDGSISEDISYRVWSSAGADRVNLSTGTIDVGATAEIQNVDPRFSTAACHTLLSVLGIWIDSNSISLTEVYDAQGVASRTLRVKAPRSEIDRLVQIPRRCVWEGERLKVTFSKVTDALDLASEGRPKATSSTAEASGSPRSRQQTKRSHAPSLTPARKTKSKVDETDLEFEESCDLQRAPVEGKDDALSGERMSRCDEDSPEEPCRRSLEEDLEVTVEDAEAGLDEEEQSGRDDRVTFFPGDIVRAPVALIDGKYGPEATLRLIEPIETGWLVERLDFTGAKVRARAGNSPGWSLEQPLRKPKQWTKWFGCSKYGAEAEVEARKCKSEWDAEDSRARLVEDSCSMDVDGSSTLLYSLNKARKCDVLETAALLSSEGGEGHAECARRQTASKFHSNMQRGEVDGEEVEPSGAMDGSAPASQ